MCKAVLWPSPNQSKMSVTNEDVSGAHSSSITTGEGGTTPTTLPRQTTTSTSTIGSTTSNGATSVAVATASLTNGQPSSTGDDVVKSGYLRKLKGKKKFFVLRQETDADKPARLEYYANEKKFRMGHPPRKSIILKACINIKGPETNLKSKCSISLHTHNDCVRISLNSEEETNEWLRVMKSLAGEEDDQAIEGKPYFEHIWLVQVLNKGLGSKENIIGPYRLCLTSKELTLLKVGEHDGRNGHFRFPLNVIRNVSHDKTFGCFFHIELGRLACTGPGQLIFKTDDNNITQNMHLLILNAMKNYSKDDIIPPRERARTYTWTNDSAVMRPSHSTTTPSMSSSIEEPRIRSDSNPSSGGRISGKSQMSPPVPIHTSNPSILFNSPNMYSTGTDSASSSYSIDYDNNNHSHGGSMVAGDKSCDEEESYVPFNPTEDQHISPKNLVNNMKLPLNHDILCGDYVDTGKDSTSSNAQTPSSYMEMQSPMSPFDNYIPMSPACAISNGKSNGKISVSHSRNSSLIEDNDGYVPMIPGGGHSRSESGAGSTAGSATGFDDAYLDMDFTRKMNLSNDDVRRASPASSESLQSNTPSSDFPLEKVTSYLTDDFEDTMRPMRCYSVGSRSDTSALGKLRAGKNRLEAVQETFRIRAMSVGSKNPRKPTAHSNTPSNAVLLSGSNKPGVGALSSSWSGSTGRWPMAKLPNNLHYPISQHTQYGPSSHANSESADSDLMELDFSKNKNKVRKRSHPGPPGSLNSTPSSTGSSVLQKLSPIPKGVLFPNCLPEVSSPTAESSDILKSPVFGVESSAVNRNYASSAPISIIGPSPYRNSDPSYAYHDASNSQSILTRLTGTDLNKLKELDDEGAYLNMDFSKPSVKIEDDSTKSLSNPKPSNNIKAEAVSPSTTKFCLNLTSPAVTALNSPQSDTAGSKQPTLCNGDLNASTTKQSHPLVTKNPATSSCSTGFSDHLVTSLPGLTRIEESPEKQEHSKASSGSITPQSPSRCAPLAKPEVGEVDDSQITYSSIDHLPPVYRPTNGLAVSSSVTKTSSCGTVAAAAPSGKVAGIK